MHRAFLLALGILSGAPGAAFASQTAPARRPTPLTDPALQTAPAPRTAPAPQTASALRPAPGLLERVDLLLARGRPGPALTLLEGRLQTRPGDSALLWRAAQAAVFLGDLSREGREAENAWYRRGILYADSALVLAPDSPDALRWAVAAHGNLAQQAGPAEAARNAQIMWELDRRLLARRPDDPVAHHSLGAFHSEVMSLNRVERWIARKILGGKALGRANWDDALFHLRRALELMPDNKLFAARYGQALERLGRYSEALAIIDRALALPVRTPLDEVYQERLQRYRRGVVYKMEREAGR